MEEKVYTITVPKEHSAVDVLMTLRSVASALGKVKVVSRNNRQALQIDPHENSLGRVFLWANEKASNQQTIVELTCATDLRQFSVATFGLLALVFLWTVVGPILFVLAVIGAYAAGPKLVETICKETEQRITSPRETVTRTALSWQAVPKNASRSEVGRLRT